MSLRYSSLHKQKAESNSHYLLHTTIPTCICALFLLLSLTAVFLNPYSPTYSITIESDSNQFVMGVPQTKDFTNEILLYLWVGKPVGTELSAQATAHMADVRIIFIVAQTALLVLLVVAYFIQRKKAAQQKLDLFVWASASSLFTVILMSLLSLLGFERLFLVFHTILFANDLWLFPPNDTLILYFPEYFFKTIAIQLVIWLIFATTALILFCRLKQKQQRLSSSKPAQHI